MRGRTRLRARPGGPGHSVPPERRALALITETVWQRSRPPEDQDTAVYEALRASVVGSPDAVDYLVLAAVGANEMAARWIGEDPADLLRECAARAGWTA